MRIQQNDISQKWNVVIVTTLRFNSGYKAVLSRQQEGNHHIVETSATFKIKGQNNIFP